MPTTLVVLCNVLVHLQSSELECLFTDDKRSTQLHSLDELDYYEVVECTWIEQPLVKLSNNSSTQKGRLLVQIFALSTV